MRYIDKQEEPPELREWRKMQTRPLADVPWADFQNPEKHAVLRALVAEQRSICCYCGCRVEAASADEVGSHIEHVRPRGRFAHQRYDYANMLASCNNGPRSSHCGHRKADWFDAALFILPLDPDCTACFRYTSAGEMLAEERHPRADAAGETIRQLGLDCAKLNASRRSAVQAILTDPTLSNDDLAELLVGLVRPDDSGRLPPYIAAIESVLQQYTGV